MSTSAEIIDATSLLPLELLGQIFIYCLPDQPDAPNLKSAPLLLCHVCSRWRFTAFSHPQLWDTLSYFFSSEEDELLQLAGVTSAANLARLWFANIGKSALSLSLHWHGMSSIQLLEDVVLSNSNHLRKLILSFRLKVDFSRFFALPPGNIEQLEYLSLKVVYLTSKFVEMSVFQSAPRLRKVLISNFDHGWINTSALSQTPLPWAQLTHLDIKIILSSITWRALLRQCVSLERCVINVYFDSVGDTATDQQVTTLSSIIDLTVRTHGHALTEIDGWFRDFRFHRLEELEICYAEFTPVQVNALHETFPLSFLQRLALNIDTLSMVSLICATTSLTELVLWLDSEQDLDPLWDTLTRPSDEASLYALPCLEVLELWLACYGDDIETMSLCAEVVKSRWRSPYHHPTAPSSLQRVALHLVTGARRIVEEAQYLLGSDIFDGLDIHIDTQTHPKGRSKKW